VLWWWLPTLIVVSVAWWRLRPADRAVRDQDLRDLQRILRGDR